MDGLGIGLPLWRERLGQMQKASSELGVWDSPGASKAKHAFDIDGLESKPVSEAKGWSRASGPRRWELVSVVTRGKLV